MDEEKKVVAYCGGEGFENHSEEWHSLVSLHRKADHILKMLGQQRVKIYEAKDEASENIILSD